MSHFTGEGSEWTKRHKAEKIIDIRSGGKLLEKCVTLEYMCLKGWNNVRGGPWTACDLKSPPVALRKGKPPLTESVFYDESDSNAPTTVDNANK